VRGGCGEGLCGSLWRDLLSFNASVMPGEAARAAVEVEAVEVEAVEVEATEVEVEAVEVEATVEALAWRTQ